MNTGRMIFSQLMDFLPLHEFRKCVARYDGERRLKTFSCLDQFYCMAWAQLTSRHSLRHIEQGLGVLPGRLYHMGIHSRVRRSTLADANETRDWRIYADFGQVLITTARQLYADERFGVPDRLLIVTDGGHDEPQSELSRVNAFRQCRPDDLESELLWLNADF